MESTPCSCCGSWEADLIFIGRDLLHNLPGEFPVKRCRECGLFYISPRPARSEIGYYYPEDYSPHNVAAVADQPTAWARWSGQRAMDKRLRAVLPYVGEQGRVLDIGCGTGNFLDNMRRLGWQSFGVEPEDRAAAYARNRFGLDVFTGELEQANYAPFFFDLVTLWDVLEHLHDSRRTLQEIARVMRLGGILVMNVPNPDGFEARLFGPYWAGWDWPRHLSVFPLATLWKLLAELGFGRVAATSAVHNTAGLPLSLGFWLSAHTKQLTLGRQASKLMTSWLARLVLAPYFCALSKLNAASFITFVARKDRVVE